MHLAMGQVAGRPEQDEDRRVRDALEAQALAQDVLDRLGARRPLALAREPEVLHRPRHVLGRGAGWAGIGWSAAPRSALGRRRRRRSTGVGGASRSASWSGGVAAIDALLGLDCVAAELVAERGEHLGPVRIVLARPEPGQQRQGDDRRRDVVVDRLLDRPAALARNRRRSP